MTRTFREWNPDQSWCFPPSPQDWLPDGHLVYFLMDVSEQLGLSPIMEKYDSEKGGKPPYHPRMMLVLLLYSYCIGVFSSRKIVARCETDVAFRVIVGDNIPDFRTSVNIGVGIWQSSSICLSKSCDCVGSPDF